MPATTALHWHKPDCRLDRHPYRRLGWLGLTAYATVRTHIDRVYRKLCGSNRFRLQRVARTAWLERSRSRALASATTAGRHKD